VERDPATGVPVRAAGVASDVTERVAALTEVQPAKANLERDLEKRKPVLAHRRLLLREVHHRMNDALQIVDQLFATGTQ
jgi:two-component sensor histidine kinase